MRAARAKLAEQPEKTAIEVTLRENNRCEK